MNPDPGFPQLTPYVPGPNRFDSHTLLGLLNPAGPLRLRDWSAKSKIGISLTNALVFGA